MSINGRESNSSSSSSSNYYSRNPNNENIIREGSVMDRTARLIPSNRSTNRPRRLRCRRGSHLETTHIKPHSTSPHITARSTAQGRKVSRLTPAIPLQQIATSS
jgi:hypothetical protein